MKRTRTSIAVLAILVLLAAAVLPGGGSHVVVLAVALLVLPWTVGHTRSWAVVEPMRFDTLERSLVLLRAPPVSLPR